MTKIDVIAQESEKAFLFEIGRGERLTIKAEKYIAAIGLIIGLQLYDLRNLSFAGYWIKTLSSLLSLSAFLSLGSALALSLVSSQIFKYYSYPRDSVLIDELKYIHITDDKARIMVAKMYQSNYDNNASINDKRAKKLTVSGALIVLGFILACCSHLIPKLVI